MNENKNYFLTCEDFLMIKRLNECKEKQQDNSVCSIIIIVRCIQDCNIKEIENLERQRLAC